MNKLEPVAWTQPSQIALLAEDNEGVGQIWNRRDMIEVSLFLEDPNVPDDVPLVTLSSAQAALDAKDARIAELEGWLKDREAMHRRAQIAEGAVAAVIALVDFWAPKRADLPRESMYLRTVRREIEKALAKAMELPPNAEARNKALEEAAKVAETPRTYRFDDGTPPVSQPLPSGLAIAAGIRAMKEKP